MPRKNRGKGTLRREAWERKQREIELDGLRRDIYGLQAERRRAEEESYQDFLADSASYDDEVSTESDGTGEEYRPYVEDYDHDWWRDDEPYDRNR